MTTLCNTRTALRSLAAAAILAASAILAPIAAPSPALAAPVAVPAEAPSGAYMDQLLGEINVHRAQAGTAPLTYATGAANQAVSEYLADLTPQMLARNACFHGTNNPVAPSWDYVASTGFATEIGGEVLGCPGEGFYWTPRQIADGWWNSASHHHSLYSDASATEVACGAYEAGRDGRGYRTVACVTYRA